MKQVLFLLAAVIFFCNCNPSADIGKNAAEQTKIKLLKQAGFDKMQKGFTYDYAVQNDSAVAILTLVPENAILNSKEIDSKNGIVLNVFMTPDGQQYNTMLKRSAGGFYQVGIRTIDGVEIPIYVYVEPQLGGGGGGQPPSCFDNSCSDGCQAICDNFIKYNILPGLQRKADSLCKPVFYCYPCPCAWITLVVKPSARRCGLVFADPAHIATSKLGNGIIIKNEAMQKGNDK